MILKQENESLLENHDIDFLYIKNSSFGDLEVFREVSTDTGRKIDLLAVSESKKLVLLVENKYKSGEPEGQLDDYLDFAEKKYSGYTILPIFLSLYGVEPTNEKYLMGDYSDVLNILTNFMKVSEDYVNRNVADFINYYIDVLELDYVLGVPKWSYWFKNALTIWFKRLKDSRLKLTHKPSKESFLCIVM